MTFRLVKSSDSNCKTLWMILILIICFCLIINNLYQHRNSEYFNNKRTKLHMKNFEFKKGIEIIHEKETNRYFLHVPVEVDWYPVNDKRNDNQVKFKVKAENRIISLDPGVRKFLVGYDPT